MIRRRKIVTALLRGDTFLDIEGVAVPTQCGNTRSGYPIPWKRYVRGLRLSRAEERELAEFTADCLLNEDTDNPGFPLETP
jgi:hypothetical protein